MIGRHGSPDGRDTLQTRLARQRIALTIARRTSIRSLGRSALIAAMVALPVAGMAAVGLVGMSMNPTAQETITTQLGHTQARMNIVNAPNPSLVQSPTDPRRWQLNTTEATALGSESPKLKEPTDLLPAGTRILPVFRTSVTATTATGTATFDALEGPTWDPSLAGHFDLVDGHSPRTDSEVMVTASTLDRLGLALGGAVHLDAPAPATVTIVGLLDNQTQPDSVQMFFGRTGALSATTAADQLPQTDFYLPDTALDWEAVQNLNQDGATVLSRTVLLNPPAATTVIEPESSGSLVIILTVGAIAGGFAAFEVILLAGAAFTVTARQQQRTLATIASVGATRSMLFRILSSHGMVLGAIGGVVGIGVGVGSGAVFMALSGGGDATRYFGFHLSWPLMLVIAVFAVFIGWVAALVPARNASRFDIVAALRGARRPPTPNRHRPIGGLILVGVGLGITLGGGVLLATLIATARGDSLRWIPVAMMITGPVLAQVGLILCAPLLLRAASRLLRRTGIGARLASQDAARNPARSVPALAAIMTATFITVFAMSVVSAGQQDTIERHQYRQALGQIIVPLTNTDYGTTPPAVTHYAHADAIVTALRDTVDVDQVRALASVHDPDYVAFSSSDKSADDGSTAVPMVAPTNLCPTSPDSPEFTKAFDDQSSAEYREAQKDPRCHVDYFSLSSDIGGHLWVGNVDDLALVLGREPTSESQRMLANGGAVALYPQYVHDGTFSINWWSNKQLGSTEWGRNPGVPLRTETLPAVVDLPAHPIFFGVFVSKSTADAIGLDYENSAILASTRKAPDVSQTDALAAAMRSLPDSHGGQIFATVETGPPAFAQPWVWGLLGLSGLIAIASAAVAIGLARFDGRQDDATLSSLGAGHRVRRSFAFWQALVITGAGTVLGAGMGLVPALALGANADIPFAPPWLQIGLTAFALPLVIASGSWLFIRRNRVSGRRVTIA